MFFFRHITCDYKDGVLTLRCRVPTFYLKQMLRQRLMNEFPHVLPENKVDVINSDCLSGVGMN